MFRLLCNHNGKTYVNFSFSTRSVGCCIIWNHMWPVGLNDRTNSLQQQGTTTKKQLSLSCSRQKPLIVIYFLVLAATGHVCAEWIMLVWCDSELKGYLCRSAQWSLLMTSRWSSSIFKSLLSTREAVVMSASVIGVNEILLLRKSANQRPVATAPAPVRERNLVEHLAPCTLWYAYEHLWEKLLIQKLWKITYSFFFSSP